MKTTGRNTPAPDDERPEVPGFRTWRGIYRFVLICFVGCVLLLTLFTHCFSR